MKDIGFDFFNRLSGTIDIEMSEPAVPLSDTVLQWNQKALPTAKLKSVSFNPNVYQRHDDVEPFRDIEDYEYDLVVFEAPSITLISEGGDPIKHLAPDDKQFTVRNMIEVIKDHELQTRGDSHWFGGIDVHHVFFEGLVEGRPREPIPLPDGTLCAPDPITHPDRYHGSDDVWTICWGS